MRKQLFCTDSRISVTLMFNADGFDGILAVAEIDGEYWFSVGWFKTEAGAVRSARRQFACHGYTLDA